MLSMPPVTTTVASPARMSSAARLTALSEDAHTLFTVRAGTLVGKPAFRAAWRAGIWPMPAVRTVPMITWWTCAPSTLARWSTSRMTVPPSSGAVREERPPPSLPNGVRAAATMTTASIECIVGSHNRPPTMAPATDERRQIRTTQGPRGRSAGQDGGGAGGWIGPLRREAQAGGQAAGAPPPRAAAGRRLRGRRRAAGPQRGARIRGRRGGDRGRPHRRADRLRDGQRPDRQGRLVGPPHGGEDRPDAGDRGAAAGSHFLPGRLRRRAYHRPGPDVPWPPPCGPHLLQRGPAFGAGSPNLPALWSVRGRRRVHPGLLRPDHHGRGPRQYVPGLTPHGRDGDRRESDPGGDGRRPHALHRERLRRHPGGHRGRGHRARPPLPQLLPAKLPGGPADAAGRRPSAP